MRMGSCRALRGILGLIALILAVPVVSASPDGQLVRTFSSNKSFEETMKHLQWQCGTYGLTITNAMNYGDVFRKTKVTVPRSAMIEVVRQKWIEDMLNLDPSMAIVLPIRLFVLSAADGKVSVAYISPSGSAELAGNQDQRVTQLLGRIDERLTRLIEAATR